MIYNILLHLVTFFTTIHIIIKYLAFSSPLNDPLRGTNGIHEGVASENHCPLEGQVEAKDYNTNITEVTSLHIQYKNQHGKNEQEIKSEQVQCW